MPINLMALIMDPMHEDVQQSKSGIKCDWTYLVIFGICAAQGSTSYIFKYLMELRNSKAYS